MSRCVGIIFLGLLLTILLPDTMVSAAEVRERVFAHKVVEDEHGVITPWYKGQNGQFDNRIRIAAETIKRYPWVPKGKAPVEAPEFVFNSTWRIADDGTISIPELSDWYNGTMGQNAARMLNGMVDYYQYSGDPAAKAIMTLMADTFLDVCLTSEDHPWPKFPISVPIQGEPYGRCDPKGWIQLDIVGELGVGMLRAYQVTGNERWREAVVHWGELLAAHRNPVPGADPWPRYANPEAVVYKWDEPEDQPERLHWSTQRHGNILEGSSAYILTFFDELIRLGEHGKGDSFIAAREAGQAYFRDVLLPNWYINSTWGHNYWDWEAQAQLQTTTDWAMRYILANKTAFPNWRNDVRNILSLFLNHTSASPLSNSEVYNGAWAFPESLNCCGESLAWAPMEFALVLARYGEDADSEWARELARRMAIISTYDAHPTGVVEDGLNGGPISADGWFIGTHPSVLAWLLKAMAWQPDILGPNRENHIMHSSGVVSEVSYRDGRVTYRTYDAPAGTHEVLRLAFEPREVKACGKDLSAGKGYTAKALDGGDHLVTVHHAGCTEVVVSGNDPQKEEKVRGLSHSFTGNQFRLLGTVGPDGGRADVYVDGEKQLAGIDFWNPERLTEQVVYSKSGLSNGRHEIRLVPNGVNPISDGSVVKLDRLQFSKATGESGVGVGGGPTDTQRMIFGYTERDDYIDEMSFAWRPGTELITRIRDYADTVAKTWWTMKQAVFIKNTPDDVLYQYGVHWPEFVVNVTVGPGTYYARLKLAETEYTSAGERLMDIYINDELVAENLDVYARAGGNTKLDLVYEGIEPKNGIIEVRLQGKKVNGYQVEAMLQALEVGIDQGTAHAETSSVSIVGQE